MLAAATISHKLNSIKQGTWSLKLPLIQGKLGRASYQDVFCGLFSEVIFSVLGYKIFLLVLTCFVVNITKQNNFLHD